MQNILVQTFNLHYSPRFPPKSNPAARRLVKTHGSLDLVPLARNYTDRISPWTRQSDFLGTVDPKLCLRGEAEATGTCNKHTCPGKWNFYNQYLSHWLSWVLVSLLPKVGPSPLSSLHFCRTASRNFHDIRAHISIAAKRSHCQQ